MRFFSKHDVSIEVLRAQDEAALNELLIAQLPPSVEVAMQVAGDTIEQRMDALAREVPRIDATLEGATRSTLSRMQDDLKKLHAKIVQAAKRKDETLRRQFHHAQAQAFPGGHPQEREIGFVTFLNKYGPGLVDRLHRGASRRNGNALGDHDLNLNRACFPIPSSNFPRPPRLVDTDVFATQYRGSAVRFDSARTGPTTGGIAGPRWHHQQNHGVQASASPETFRD